ncbi:MAG TPA: hypothetical protein VGY57_16455 [Vicinamibacterales bacterium]|nr:hypothetical protein [Vicinamibacterales bacterium]
MDAETEALLERAKNPRLIPGIYNYCDRRCERCPFTERCLTYIDVRAYEETHPDAGPFDQVEQSFQQTFELIEAWCEREGIDFERLRAEASAKPEPAMPRVDEAVRANPLSPLARAYSKASYEIVRSLQNAELQHAWPAAVTDAIDTIAWFSSMIGAKVHRALHGLQSLPSRDRRARAENDGFDHDEVQNDWNGSAKAARLGIAASIAAWETILTAGEAASDSPMRQIVSMLRRIDEGIADAFPLAMEFVRPGFDEPDVAAGALTTLAPYERRRQSADPLAL